MTRITLLAAMLLASIAFAPATHADRSPLDRLRIHDDAALWQARSCVGEVGWTDLDACDAMTWVHIKRAAARGLPLRTMIREYSAPVRRAHRRPRHRPWIVDLTTTGPAPATWHRGSWSRAQAGFRTVLERVEKVLAGEVPDPCPEAVHYGGPMDGSPPRHERDPECAPSSRQLFFRPVSPGGAS